MALEAVWEENGAPGFYFKAFSLPKLVLWQRFLIFFVSFWALGAAAASSIGFPTMHCQIGFPIINLLNKLPHDVLANHASRSSDCHRHLNRVLATYASQTYVCQNGFLLSSSRSTRHMPSFANQNTRSSSNNNSSPRRQQHSRAAKNFQRCLPNIPSNSTLAKYASQMVLAKSSFKSYTCQISQIYLQIVHLPNMHPKWCLPNTSSNRTLAKYAHALVK